MIVGKVPSRFRYLWVLVFCAAAPSCGRIGVELLSGDSVVGAPPVELPTMPATNLDAGAVLDAAASSDANSALDAAPVEDAAPTQDGDAPLPDSGSVLDAGVSTDANVDATALDDAALPADAGLPPCEGASVRGLCWYFGPLNNSCQQVCASRGGYDTRTPDVVGTTAQGGSVQACNEILAALGQDGTATPARRSDDKGYGCHLWGGDLWWIENTPAFSPSVAGTSVRIACACLR